ncbi:PREDICTED: protein PFC0760c-like, partial [Nicrophorus vespilloides]|uniref:Protein PFC0760c-like n=1 Tax=Nicrophorus vespilloides TaxID=110193 RepID=A0ABM1MW74_NICVS
MNKLMYEDISDDEDMLCFDEKNCIDDAIGENHMDSEVIYIENDNDEIDIRNINDDALFSDRKMNSFNESNISKCFTAKCENNGNDEVDIINVDDDALSSDRKRKFNEDSEDDDSEDDYSEDDDNESDAPIFYYEEQGACDLYYEK